MGEKENTQGQARLSWTLACVLESNMRILHHAVTRYMRLFAFKPTETASMSTDSPTLPPTPALYTQLKQRMLQTLSRDICILTFSPQALVLMNIKVHATHPHIAKPA